MASRYEAGGIHTLVERFAEMRTQYQEPGALQTQRSTTSAISTSRTRYQKYSETTRETCPEAAVKYDKGYNCIFCRCTCRDSFSRICSGININCFGTQYVKTDMVTTKSEEEFHLQVCVYYSPPGNPQENQYTNTGFWMELTHIYGENLDYLMAVAISFLRGDSREFWESWTPGSTEPLPLKRVEALRELLDQANNTFKNLRQEMMAQQIKKFLQETPARRHSPSESPIEHSGQRSPDHASVVFPVDQEGGAEGVQPSYRPKAPTSSEQVIHAPVPMRKGERVECDDSELATIHQGSGRKGVRTIKKVPESETETPQRRKSYDEAIRRSNRKIYVTCMDLPGAKPALFDSKRLKEDLLNVAHISDSEADKAVQEVADRLPENCTRQNVWDTLLEVASERRFVLRETSQGRVSTVASRTDFRSEIEAKRRVADIDPEVFADMMRELGQERQQRRNLAGRIADCARGVFRRRESHENG